MNVGLPGTGIGGVFYLLLALFMPFYELYKTLRGESSFERWRVVFRQLLMFVAIMGGMWGVGLILGLLIKVPAAVDTETIGQFVHEVSTTGSLWQLNLFHIAPVIFSLGTLACIYVLTRLVGLALHSNANR